MEAIVDEEDFKKFNKFKWQASKQGRRGCEKYYAIRFVQKNKVRKKLWLHREITNCPDHLVVDHADNDGLNCQKDNLSNMTQEENMKKCYHWKNKESSWGGPPCD